MVNVRQENQKLGSQIVRSPARIKNELAGKAAAVEREKAAVTELQAAARDRQAKSDGTKIASDVSGAALRI